VKPEEKRRWREAGHKKTITRKTSGEERLGSVIGEEKQKQQTKQQATYC